MPVTESAAGGRNLRIGADDPATMTPAQRARFDAIAAGPRGYVPDVLRVLLDAPGLLDAVQAIGRYLRFEASLPPQVREIAILAAAAECGSGYEWNEHLPIARAARASEGAIDAAFARRATAGEHGDVVRFVTALVRGAAPDATLIDALIDRFGRRGLTELTVLAGYYRMIAAGLTVAGIERPLERDPAPAAAASVTKDDS